MVQCTNLNSYACRFNGLAAKHFLRSASQWLPGSCKKDDSTISICSGVGSTRHTIHGAWPSGPGPAFAPAEDCKAMTTQDTVVAIKHALNSKDNKDLKAYMDINWPTNRAPEEGGTVEDVDRDFQFHEWSKHGTCMPSANKLDTPAGYFTFVTSLFKRDDVTRALAAVAALRSSPAPNAVDNLEQVGVRQTWHRQAPSERLLWSKS
jgi:ribonuclease I